MTTETQDISRRDPAFSFSGTGKEYFGIWIVNLALSIVTLGIYSAWAKVRTLKYFYGHTRLAGESFEYLADPVRILIGRLIAVALLVIYSVCVNFLPDVAFIATCVLVLLIPFVLVSASAFRMRNTAYRNIRLHFRADYGAAYRRALPPVIAILAIAGAIYSVLPETFYDPQTNIETPRSTILPTLLTFGVLPFLPWLDYIRTSFIIGHTQYGNVLGNFTGSGWDFYKLYLKLMGGGIGVMFLFAFISAGLSAIMIGAGGNIGEELLTPRSMAFFFTLGLLFYAVLFLLMGWFGALRNNLIRSRTRFGDNQVYGSFQGRDLAWITFSNIVAIVCTLGLFIPWALIRLARYNAEHTDMDTQNIDEAVAVAAQERSAIGEEVGEFFDIDIGL